MVVSDENDLHTGNTDTYPKSVKSVSVIKEGCKQLRIMNIHPASLRFQHERTVEHIYEMIEHNEEEATNQNGLETIRFLMSDEMKTQRVQYGTTSQNGIPKCRKRRMNAVFLQILHPRQKRGKHTHGNKGTHT